LLLLIALQILLLILLLALALIALVVVLLSFSIRLHISYIKGSARVRVYYLFLWYNLLRAKPGKPDKPQKSPKKKKAKKTKKPVDATEKKVPFRETLARYRPLLRATHQSWRKILKSFIIYKVEAGISLGAQDAHKTALLYAKAANAINLLMQILEELFTVKIKHIRVSPDFIREKTSADFSLRVRLRPIVIFPAGARLLYAFFKTFSDDKKTKEKGVKI
jgi:hypothetical protein